MALHHRPDGAVGDHSRQCGRFTQQVRVDSSSRQDRRDNLKHLRVPRSGERRLLLPVKATVRETEDLAAGAVVTVHIDVAG
jgi:hypothetical protein